jgi:ketosteroid isomerase-like protein
MKGNMPEAQPADDLPRLIAAAFEAGSPTLEGPEGIEQMARFLERGSHPDLVTVMVPQDGPAVEHPGIEGFREALDDWISPYERFRLELVEVIAMEDKVVFRARQIGTTKHGGVEIDTPGVSVWSVDDGQVRQVAFYLDEDEGLRAAGLDPGEVD